MGTPFSIVESERHGGTTSTCLQIALPVRAQSVAVARACVAGLQPVDDGAMEALLIVVSELVTNAVRHAGLTSGQTVTLRAKCLPDRVRVEVIDHGPGFDVGLVGRIDPSADGGFGLRIVARLSECWGALPESGTVWAEVASHGDGAGRH